MNEGEISSQHPSVCNGRLFNNKKHDRRDDSKIALDILYYLCSIELAAMISPNQVIKDEQNHQKTDFVSKVRVLK
jgi:hypothetical protein